MFRIRRVSRRWLAVPALIVLGACAADRIVVDDGGNGGTTPTVVLPALAPIMVGGTHRLTARVTHGGVDTTTAAGVTWTSSNAAVARVTDGNLLTAMGAGAARLTAAYQGASAEMQVQVVAAPVTSVTITPATVTLLPGAASNLTLAVRDANGATVTGRPVTWISSDPLVGSLSAGTLTGATLTALRSGVSTITANVDGVVGTSQLTVGAAPVAAVQVTLNAGSITVAQQTTATAVLRDASGNVLTGRAIVWSTSHPSFASVDAAGQVRGVGPGTAEIKATSEGRIGSAFVTVTAQQAATVSLQPAAISTPIGTTVQVTATLRDAGGNVISGRQPTWSSNAPAIATVDATGSVVALAIGTAQVSATADGVTATASVTVVPVGDPVPSVTPGSASVTVGQTVQLAAQMRDGAGNPIPATFTWRSANDAIATVSATGNVTGVAAGTVSIIATADGRSASATITVNPVPVASVTIAPTSLALVAGQSGTFVATCRDAAGNALTGRTVGWTTSAGGIATINAVGLVQAVAAGSATMTATCENRTATAGVTVTAVPVASVTVSPATGTMQVGSTQQLTATLRDAAGNTLTGRTVTWTRTPTGLATVSTSGLVTASAAGTVTVTATSGSVSGSATLTITAPPPAPVASVVVTPSTSSVSVGFTQQLAATARDAAGTTLTGRTITWRSSDAAIASVTSTGLVTGVAVGTATIIATSEGIDGMAAVTVTTPPVGGNTVDATLLPLATGQTRLAGTYGRNLTAGQTYQDPRTAVTVLKVTDNRTPMTNSGMYHGYSEGGPAISQPWTGTDGSTYYTLWLAWGDGWFVDVRYPQLTLSNWRAAPVSAEIEGTWSLNPATPRIFYYGGSNTINRYDTQTNRIANTTGFPFSIPTSNGTYFTWVQTQLNDTWIVGMLGSNSTVVGYRPSDGTVRYITPAGSGLGIDEPHIDREQPVVYISADGNDPQNVIYNLNTNTRINPTDTQGIVNDDHNAPMRGKIVGVSWQANATVVVDWQGRVTRVPGPSPTNWAGDFHTAGQWIFGNPGEYFAVDQWQSNGTYPIANGMIGLQSVTTGDTRLLVAHDGTGGGYQSGGQPHMTFAPDGKLMMWTSNMQGSGRFDVFLAKLPTR